MHVFFSGIGGAGIGPLALIAKQAGYTVSGSDASNSSYIEYLSKHGIKNISIGQTAEQIKSIHQKNPIDWFVYSSAIPRTNPNHPELLFCKENGIKSTKRDDFLNKIITDKNLRLIAIAGTHGKTTTTAMAIWVFKQLGIPLSYSVGAKISFGDMGEFVAGSKYFVYEADEFDRNFLSFSPEFSLITGVAWDHPDIYPTISSYYDAFSQFLDQSKRVALWQDDAEKLNIKTDPRYEILSRGDSNIDGMIKLTGRVNRFNGWQVAKSLELLLEKPLSQIVEIINNFPGLSRRFEKIGENVYSDYAHTPEKIRGALQTAKELAGENIIVVYEGLHNTRQHFIKDDLANLFDDVKQLYIVPSYLAREDKSLALLSPADLVNLLSNKSKGKAVAAKLDGKLLERIKAHAKEGDLVLCLSAGGSGSLDEWLRKKLV